MQECGLNYTTVEACGFGTTEASCHNYTVSDFCQATPYAERYDGGLTGAPAGLFSYFNLALYWAPSSCRQAAPDDPLNVWPDSDIGQSGFPGGFCSNYTKAGTYASKHLVLHGLWADFGSQYGPGQEPRPPYYHGSYQGYPMWCNGPHLNASRCAVTGDACPWPAAKHENFSQHSYEKCMRKEGIKECTAPAQIMLLSPLFKRLAPGYIGDGTFLDHEWFKHGSCVGGKLTQVPALFFSTALWLALKATLPGTAADTLIHKNIGGQVSLEEFDSAFELTAVPTCKKDRCVLEEIWMCYDRNDGGFPTHKIKCPAGTLASNTCRKHGCSHIEIPAYQDVPSPAGVSAA
eukprot:gene4192-4440_t